jgi:hypothetical protein
MQEMLLGIGISLVPMVLALIAKRGTTRKIGRNISKILRSKLGKPIENAIELTLHDIVAGMREDNIEQEKKKAEIEKKVAEIKGKSPL